MKTITVVTPTFNESKNVANLYNQVRDAFKKIPDYKYEHIFIDNSSNDNTVDILKEIAAIDKNVKIIVNVRNFGWIKSPYYGLLQGNGDATILIVADLQDPPSLILDFIKKWEEGYKIVIGVKTNSKEHKFMFSLRKLFYNTISRISDIDQIKNFTGFGLYDKQFIDVLKSITDPYPYFRGLVSELGFNRFEIKYTQPKRDAGKTSSSFFNLYDVAMLGFISYSKIPLRIASFIGFSISIISLLVAFVYFIYKLIDWYNFQLGMAPLVIGIFFLGGIQLIFLGIIGEYISSILTQVKQRPLVIEKERINFETEKNIKK